MLDNIYSPYLTDEDLTHIVRAQVKTAGGVRKAAYILGVHPGDISHFLKGTRGPSPMLLKGLGYERVTYYVRK